MSEQESTPVKKSLADLTKLFEGIELVAKSQAQEAVEPDPLALVGEEDLEKERVAAEIEHLHEDVRQTKLVNKARIVVLTCLFILISLWIVSVMTLTAVSGWHVWGFQLSDKVLITYITSTTVSVLGLFTVAANWLFSAQGLLSQARQQYPRSPKVDPKRKRL
jgi:hypothetical protein